MKRVRKTCAAFTLVELLVVIGIIGVLISILLPALARARQAAQTIACSANIRSILQGMQIYSAQNGGSIPGSPYTSARLIYSNLPGSVAVLGISNGNLPSVIQAFDWASPIAKVMGVRFDDGGSTTARAARYLKFRDIGQFRCPSNDILAPQFGAGLPAAMVPIGLMVSYNTPIGFMLVHYDANSKPPGAWGLTVCRPEWNAPAGYNVKVAKVGDPSRKVFIADGAKFSAGNGSPSVGETVPDADLNYDANLGGAFSDQGPTKFTRAWNRDRVPGNGGSGIDCRTFWARHSGRAKIGAPAGSYRFNLGFFDGHAETMDDLSGCDPNMYYPKGTELTVNTTQMWPDIQKQFFGAFTGTWIVK